MITYINRDRLEPHPDNPRKDLGDLTELVASISKQGLLQNLTVVPSPENEGKYRIVIGHRRFAAASLAGMQELPCAIDEHMDYAEQLAVMMSENIQRSDLTITEKVGGVQMMMDLGLNALDVAQKTGISSSTVYKYVKLAQLNRKEMLKAEQRGATLMQFAEINDIEDAQLRKEALDKAGTGEYSIVMAKVRTERAKADMLPQFRKICEEYGVSEIEEHDWNKHRCAEYYHFRDATGPDKLRAYLKGKKKAHVYRVRDYDIALYEVREIDPDADAKAEAKRISQEKIAARFRDQQELARAFREKRDAFIRAFDPVGSDMTKEVLRFVVWVQTRTNYQYCPMVNGLFDQELMRGVEREPSYTGSLKVSADLIYTFNVRKLWCSLLIGAYERLCGTGSKDQMDRYTGKYKPDDDLIGLYEWLQVLGYDLSTDEMDWLDGTHQIYQE